MERLNERGHLHLFCGNERRPKAGIVHQHRHWSSLLRDVVDHRTARCCVRHVELVAISHSDGWKGCGVYPHVMWLGQGPFMLQVVMSAARLVEQQVMDQNTTSLMGHYTYSRDMAVVRES
jgi:hypothetical protein